MRLDEALDVGDDQIEQLLDEGWRPEDVALLTTGSRHPEQTERQKAGNQAYWDSSGTPSRCSTGTCSASRAWSGALSCWWSMTQAALERARERLYVGLSRARDQLVVCGDPAFIAEHGGADLAHRLGIGG